MAAPSSTPGAFVDFVVADLVAPPPSSTSAPTASSIGASPSPGEFGESTGPPMSGASAGDVAGLPSMGASALVETDVADEDVAPPVMGVPPSSDEEEELLADIAGAQPFPGVAVVDGEAQTAHLTPIPFFDAHEVGVQTTNEVIFSSFVGDTCQEALATAIRALSKDDRDRLVGAMRLAEEQPLVDVAPTGGADASASSSGPPLDLLDLTPGLPPAPPGIVDPGPSPATARSFWEEQDATAVAEMAAAKPVPDDDIDAGPPTALEAFLAEQDAAATAAAQAGPGASSSSAPGPGPKKPFKKAPPPALVLEESSRAAAKAPPMPCPDKPISFLAEPPVKPKPAVKRPPAGAKAPPRFDDQGQVVEQKPVGPPAAARDPPVPKQEVSSGGPVASSLSGGATSDAPEVVGGAPAPSDDYLRRQAFIRQEQMARSQAGLILLPDGATYQDAIESSIARGVGGTAPGGRRSGPRQGQAQGASAAPGRDRDRPAFRAPSLVGSSWLRRSRRPLQLGRLRLGPRQRSRHRR